MKYTAHFAYYITCVADIDITADSPAQAIKKARSMLNTWDGTPAGDADFEPVWDSASDHRVLFIENEAGEELDDSYITMREAP